MELGMLKNITFSADERLISLARAKASLEHKTLNAEFRLWLERYVGNPAAAQNYRSLMKSMSTVENIKKFTREGMNG
jgi:hypothetical protein